MPDKEFQRRAFVGRGAQLVNRPFQGGGVDHAGHALGRHQDAGDHEIRVYRFVNDNVGRPGLGNVHRQVREQVLQLRVVRGDRHMGGVRIGRPVVEHGRVNPVRPHEADAVDNDAGGPGRRRHGAGVRPGGGLAVREHHDHLGVGGRRVKHRRRLGKRVRVVGGTARRQAVYGGLQGGHRGDELGVLDGRVRKADDADPAAGANGAVLHAVGGLVNDVNKRLGAKLQVGQGAARHAPRPVQHQDDVRGVAANIRRSGERQGNLQRAGAVNPVRADGFVGIV